MQHIVNIHHAVADYRRAYAEAVVAGQSPTVKLHLKVSQLMSLPVSSICMVQLSLSLTLIKFLVNSKSQTMFRAELLVQFLT